MEEDAAEFAEESGMLISLAEGIPLERMGLTKVLSILETEQEDKKRRSKGKIYSLTQTSAMKDSRSTTG